MPQLEKTKYYAISKGRKTGIFRHWNEAAQHVNGYPKAQYKGFTNLQLAVEAMEQAGISNPPVYGDDIPNNNNDQQPQCDNKSEQTTTKYDDDTVVCDEVSEIVASDSIEVVVGNENNSNIRSRRDTLDISHLWTKLAQMDDEVEELSKKFDECDLTLDIVNIIEKEKVSIQELEDAKVQIKHSCKRMCEEKVDIIMDSVGTLKEQIRLLGARVQSLEKENTSLKSQIGEIRDTKNCNAKRKSPTKVSATQTDGATYTDNDSTSSQESLEQLTVTQYTAAVSVKNSFSILADPSMTADNVNSNQECRDSHSPTQERRDMDTASDKTERRDMDTASDKTRETQDSIQHRKDSSPAETLKAATIYSQTTVLFVGDSVIKNIDVRRLVPRAHNVQTQKICVPGLKVSELKQWLASLPTPCSSVQHVTVHIGVNTCPGGEISVGVWEALILSCKRAFPNAELRYSSIVPAYGRNGLNNSIKPSNENLIKACNQHTIAVVDNTNTFLTSSGAPRKRLWRQNDPVHPSPAGTARLASNLHLTRPAKQPNSPSDHWSGQPSREPNQAFDLDSTEFPRLKVSDMRNVQHTPGHPFLQDPPTSEHGPSSVPSHYLQAPPAPELCPSSTPRHYPSEQFPPHYHVPPPDYPMRPQLPQYPPHPILTSHAGMRQPADVMNSNPPHQLPHLPFPPPMPLPFNPYHPYAMPMFNPYRPPQG